MNLTPSDIQFIQQKLLRWFEENQRPLPWRKLYGPYQVWISEIMLQQTQVKTMLPYFERWIKKFPDLPSVAQASEEDILKMWEGLGYYSRARNLHRAAKLVMEKHAGIFPSSHKEILTLPGIGKYTAAAISSIAFNQDHPVVDGNVIRVLARYFAYTKNTRLPEAEQKMWAWMHEILPKNKARYFNQAIMEFGALRCTPAATDCLNCPLSLRCQAYGKKMVDVIPDRGPKKIIHNIKVAIAVIRKGKEIFIQKRPPDGLMAGLWEFPGGKVENGELELDVLLREIKEGVGITIKNSKHIKNIRHAYTSFKVDLHCYSADYDSGEIKLKAATEGRWVLLEDLQKFAFPSANARLIADLVAEA